MESRIGEPAKAQKLLPIVTSGAQEPENDSTTGKTTSSLESAGSTSPSSPVNAALARPPRSKDRIPSPLPRSYTLDRILDANSTSPDALPRSATQGDMATATLSSNASHFSTRQQDYPLPTKFDRPLFDDPVIYTPPLSSGTHGSKRMEEEAMTKPSHSFSFDSDIFNNYLEESSSFSSYDPPAVVPPPIAPDQQQTILPPSQYPLGFDHLPPISVSPASPPRRALPAAPTSRNIATAVEAPQAAVPVSSKGLSYSDVAKERKVVSEARSAVEEKQAAGVRGDDDAWSGILDETPRAEEDSGREFFRERFASNGYKYDRSEDSITEPSAGPTSHRIRESSTSNVLPSRAPQTVALPPSPSVSRTSSSRSSRSRSHSLSTTAPPLPSTSTTPSTSKSSLTSHRSFSPLRSSDYGAARRSSTPYLPDTREETMAPRRRSELSPKMQQQRTSERPVGGFRTDDAESNAIARYARQRAATEGTGKGSAFSSTFDSAPSPTRMRRSPTITQSSVFDQSSPRSDGSPRSAPPTQTIFNRRDQPSLSTRSLQPIRTAAPPPSSLSPLSQNGGPAPEWLSHPPASRRTPSLSPPLISPTSASTVRRSSLNNPAEYESPSRSKLSTSSSRSSSRSSNRGAKESSSAEGYYSSRPHESPPIDTALATILRNSPATLSFRSPLPRSDSSTLQQQNPTSPTRESPAPIRTKGQRRISDKKPPALRAKSVRRTSAVLRKMESSEDLSSSVDGNQYASADDSSLGGGGFSDFDGTDSPRKLPGQLSASDFVDAYGAFDNSAPPSDNELGRMSASSSRFDLESNSYVASPPAPNRSRSGKFIDVPVQTRSHSRTSSNEMIDELDVQIEEAMANFAFHGITPTSPTGPPPLLSPYRTDFGPPQPIRRISEVEDDRRPSLGMSSQSEDEVYHEADSSRESFSQEYDGYRGSPHSRSFPSPRGEVERRTSAGRIVGSTTAYDAREEYEKSIRLLSPATVYDGDEGSPSMGGPDASEDDDFNAVDPPRRPSRQSDSGSLVQPLPPYPLATSAANNTRGDAKARAAAFVADLRRSRGLNASEDSTGSTVIPVVSGSTNRESTSTKRASDEYSNLSSRRGSDSLPPRSDSALTSVQLARRRSSERSRLQDGTASTVSLASTLSAHGGLLNGTPTTMATTTSIPATITPRLETISAAQSISQTPVPSPAPSPRPDRSAGLTSIRKSRLLPPCATYGDILQQKTAGERARSYAVKINGLAAEESGLNVWISVITGVYTYSPSIASGHSGLNSPSLQVPTHAARNDPSAVSAVSFPIREGAYRAKEIARTPFSPDDLIPSVPYPGVLATHRFINPRDREPSSSSARSRERTVPTIGALAKTTFMSLGRKTSRRTGHSSAPATVGGTARGMITGPMGINIGVVGPPPSFISRASSGSVTGGSSIRSLSGPRMPGQGNNSRTSVDGIGWPSSPSSMSLAQQARPITPQTAREREVEGEKLAMMSDVLTQANRADLLDCLRRNGGDVSAAISEWVTLFDRD